MNPGLLTGPYLPIYGFGNCFLYGFCYRMNLFGGLNDYLSVFLIFLFSAFFMTMMELVSGLFLLKHYNLRLWNYEKEKFNYKGVICLRFSLIWGLVSIVYYYLINPFVDRLLWYYIENIYLSYFVGMLSGFFIIDFWNTMGITNAIKKYAKNNNFVVYYEEFKEKVADFRQQLGAKRRFFIKPRIDYINSILDKIRNQ